MAVECLDLAVAHLPEVGGRDIEPGSVGWITPAGVSNGPRKVPRIDSSIATTSPSMLTLVNVGKHLAHPDDHIAQLLTPAVTWSQ
jgi:hypothetical protein